MRTERKGREVLDLHPTWSNHVTFVSVSDMLASDGFDVAFDFGNDGFDYIIHTASPVNFSAKNLQKELIDPAVQG